MYTLHCTKKLLVLYHCCVSLSMAKAVERGGFADTELVRVAERPPDLEGKGPSESHAVSFLESPYGKIH